MNAWDARQHLKLDKDDLCNVLGHTLLPRTCIHCGMTIHEISDANNGMLPTRESVQDTAERRMVVERELERAQARIAELHAMLEIL